MHLIRTGWTRLLLGLLVVLAMGVWLRQQRADGRYHWPAVVDQGSMDTLGYPAFLVSSHNTALIWKPGTFLVYQSLMSPEPGVGILAYPDVNPRRWLAVPASSDTYHIVWIEQDGRLRSAQVNRSGATIRGPIEITTESGSDFSLLPLATDHALVVWINESRRQLAVTEIDQEGRPGVARYPIPAQISHGAAALDRENRLHLAWLASPTPRTQIVYYQLDGTASSSAPHNFNLATGESLITFALGLDLTHGYILWSTTTIERPDVERVFVLAFPLEQPTNSTITELQLPPDFHPSGEISAPDLRIGRVDKRVSRLSETAFLRWPRPAAGQHTLFPVAIAVRTSEGWRAAVVYFKDGMIRGFQVVAGEPVDAVSPLLAVDEAGNLHLAWGGLSGSTPHLYRTSPAN